MALARRIEDKMDGGGVGEKTNAMNSTMSERQVGYCRLQEGTEGRMDGTRGGRGGDLQENRSKRREKLSKMEIRGNRSDSPGY
jgi:hypothetical protein